MPWPRPGHHNQFHRDLDLRDNENKEESIESQASPAELTIDVPIDGDDDDDSRMLKVGSQLSQEMQQELVDFLRATLDVFAWTHSDMCGISSDIASHTLNIDRGISRSSRKGAVWIQRDLPPLKKKLIR